VLETCIQEGAGLNLGWVSWFTFVDFQKYKYKYVLRDSFDLKVIKMHSSNAGDPWMTVSKRHL